MKFKDLVLKDRSYRRFRQDAPVSMKVLRELVELARFSPTGGNVQPLKFMLSNDASKNALIFPNLAWAGYLKDWRGPAEDERPTAYVIILGDKRIKESFGCDHGIAAQSILLGAAEKGIGGCMVGSVQRRKLGKALALPAHFEILLVLALGKPSEKVVLEDVGADGSIKYWRDAGDVHHVPKRSLDELIVSG